MVKPTPSPAFGLREIEMIAGRQIDTANAVSALAGLESYGYPKLGMAHRHRMAQYMAQLMHESGRFRYDREVWGPTPAQKRYDTRTDLGNTAAVDGDGRLYAGRTTVQITGKANYAAFTKWCKDRFASAPDFVKMPDLVNTNPWEGLAPLWYWETRGLQAPADAGDVAKVTKIINGGHNGLADRQDLYVRAALVLLGYGPTDVVRFQMDADITVDGVVGPKTRGALHRALLIAPQLRPGVAQPIALMKPSTVKTVSGYGAVGIVGAAIAALFSWYYGG